MTTHPSLSRRAGSVLHSLLFTCLSVTAMAAGALADDPQPYYFTTLAGQASRGRADGSGSGARFSGPTGAVVDGAGNIYVADTLNHTIRLVSPSGVVSTFAGSAGSPGSTDGTGSAARFHEPSGVARDNAGNIFVADRANQLIRKITPAGVVTTLAGSVGESGAVDGAGSAARFSWPISVAVNGAGTIFVADNQNHLIRQISPAGVVTTLAGTAGSNGSSNGTGSVARFFYPTGVTVDGAGNVYVADHSNATVRKITPTGVVTTLAGMAGQIGADDGTGSTARFWFPRSVAADNVGNVFVADTFNCTVRHITAAGVVTTRAGQAGSEIAWTDGTGSAARFGYLTGVTVDGAGNAYAVDQWHNTLRKITAAGVVTTLAGTGDSIGSVDGPNKMARFYRPTGVAVDGVGNVYVADKFNSTIRRISAAGVVTTLAGLAGSTGAADGIGSAARFEYPQSVAVDGAGNVYVAEPSHHTIRKITSAGVVTTFAGTTGISGSADGTGSAARFNYPYGVAVDGAGNVYVADRNNGRIRHVTPAGIVTTLAGTGIFGSADGTGNTAQFSGPEGVAVDKAGYVYVADMYNNAIRRITPAGVVTTLAGQAGTAGTTDGTGSEARFSAPTSVAVDDAGNVYVIDTGSNTFRRVTPAGVVTTLAGSAELDGSGHDGIGNSVSFFHPTSVALNNAGFAYVADAENNTIRQGQLAGPPVTVAQPQSLSVVLGESVQFTVAAAAVPEPTYQWYFNDTPFSGATTQTLSFANARSTDAGDYSVVVTNPLGSVTSNKAKLTVSAATVPTPAPTPGSGSKGGGSISAWFVLALVALGAAHTRRYFRTE